MSDSKSADIDLAGLLKQRFGHDRFLPNQEDVIRNVLARRDSLVLMPTGGGKSICYQLPAVLLDGVALVVSPLIALMKDQVDALRSKGVRAAFINSTMTQAEVRDVQMDAYRGHLDILYVAPERLVVPRFQRLSTRRNAEPHRHRRSPLHLRVGPRLPARLPQPPGAARLVSQHARDRAHRHGYREGP